MTYVKGRALLLDWPRKLCGDPYVVGFALVDRTIIFLIIIGIATNILRQFLHLFIADLTNHTFIIPLARTPCFRKVLILARLVGDFRAMSPRA